MRIEPRFRWRRLLAAALTVSLAGACGGADAGKPHADAPVVTVGSGAREKDPAEPRESETTAGGAGAPRGEVRFEGKLERPLNLTVTVTPEGVLFSTSSGPVAAGCLRLGRDEITVPAQDGSYDRGGITECARRIKRARLDFAEESQVTIFAAPTIQYRTVIEIIDALRGDGAEPLFPEVTFSVKR